MKGPDGEITEEISRPVDRIAQTMYNISRRQIIKKEDNLIS